MPLIKVAIDNAAHKYQCSSETTCHDLVQFIQEKSSISIANLQLYIGYPPKLITSPNVEMKLGDVGIESGMVVTVRNGNPGSFDASSESNTFSSNENSAIIRKCIDADNSCLFNAINYCKNGISKDPEQTLRHIVAAEILTASTDIYDLERTPEAYAEWILDTNHWGGETELHILSRILSVELAVVDIRTTNIYVYGDNLGYSERIYLLYDGVHYDALVETLNGTERSLFNPADESISALCRQFASTLQTQRKFVNLSGCTIKCLVCGVGLVGQKEAVEHAKTTNHQNFGQV